MILGMSCIFAPLSGATSPPSSRTVFLVNCSSTLTRACWRETLWLQPVSLIRQSAACLQFNTWHFCLCITKSGAKTHSGLFLVVWLCFSLLMMCKVKFVVWLVITCWKPSLTQEGWRNRRCIRCEDSGTLSLTLFGEGGEGGDKILMENRDPNGEVINYSNCTCHRWTQTKVLVLPFASNAELGSLEDSQLRYKWVQRKLKNCA